MKSTKARPSRINAVKAILFRLGGSVFQVRSL